MPIENTSKRNPVEHLLDGLIDQKLGRSPGSFIEDMEAKGQQEVVNGGFMPTNAPWDELVALGFIKGPVNEDDPMFTYALIPDGWKRQATDHSMWSEVVDERGVTRVEIFYKAAFYDRSAHAHVTNVGASLATRVIYGDGDPTLPETWDVLTDAERAEFWEDVRSYSAEATAQPTHYKNGPKIKAFIDKYADADT